MNIHKHVLDHYWKCGFTLLILDPGTSNMASSNDVSTIDFIALAPRGDKSQPPQYRCFQYWENEGIGSHVKAYWELQMSSGIGVGDCPGTVIGREERGM